MVALPTGDSRIFACAGMRRTVAGKSNGFELFLKGGDFAFQLFNFFGLSVHFFGKFFQQFGSLRQLRSVFAAFVLFGFARLFSVGSFIRRRSLVGRIAFVVGRCFFRFGKFGNQAGKNTFRRFGS